VREVVVEIWRVEGVVMQMRVGLESTSLGETALTQAAIPHN